MTKCPYCDKEIRDDATYCNYCGKRIIRCPKCNKVLLDNIRFCPNDGTRIEENIKVSDTEADTEELEEAILPEDQIIPDDSAVLDEYNISKHESVEEPVFENKRKSKKHIVVIGIAVLTIAIGAIVYIGFRRSGNENKQVDVAQQDNSAEKTSDSDSGNTVNKMTAVSATASTENNTIDIQEVNDSDKGGNYASNNANDGNNDSDNTGIGHNTTDIAVPTVSPQYNNSNTNKEYSTTETIVPTVSPKPNENNNTENNENTTGNGSMTRSSNNTYDLPSTNDSTSSDNTDITSNLHSYINGDWEINGGSASSNGTLYYTIGNDLIELKNRNTGEITNSHVIEYADINEDGTKGVIVYYTSNASGGGYRRFIFDISGDVAEFGECGDYQGNNLENDLFADSSSGLWVYSAGSSISRSSSDASEVMFDVQISYDDSNQTQTSSSDTDTTGMIFPDSDSRLLAESEIQSLTKDQVNYAINEIYARHGYIFLADGEFATYYNQFSWYTQVSDDMAQIESQFNQFEKSNIDLLVKYR